MFDSKWLGAQVAYSIGHIYTVWCVDASVQQVSLARAVATDIPSYRAIVPRDKSKRNTDDWSVMNVVLGGFADTDDFNLRRGILNSIFRRWGDATRVPQTCAL